MFYEEFQSDEALREHTQSPHFQEWVAYQAAHEGLIENVYRDFLAIAVVNALRDERKPL